MSNKPYYKLTDSSERREKGKKIGLLIVLSTALLVSVSLTGCASKEDKAREQLTKLSFSYTPDSFGQAAANNDKKALQLFMDAGMNPNTKNTKDQSPLMTAAQKGNVEAIQVLLQGKSDVNDTNSQGKTALAFAVSGSQLAAVQKLIDSGADLNLKAGNESLLITAINSGNIDIVKLLLQKGVDPNKKQEKATALSIAVERGMLDAAKLLLDAKADPNVKTADGQSLLVYTLKKDQSEISKNLINHGANLNEKLPNDLNLLSLAISKGYEDIVTMMIQKGSKDASLLAFKSSKRAYDTYPSNIFEDNVPQDQVNKILLGANYAYKQPNITYDLGGRANRFTATFSSGHAPSTLSEYPYNVQFIVEGDGKTLYQGEFLEMNSQPEKIDLDVSGISKLTIKMEADKYFGLVYDSKGILNNPTITFK